MTCGSYARQFLITLEDALLRNLLVSEVSGQRNEQQYYGRWDERPGDDLGAKPGFRGVELHQRYPSIDDLTIAGNGGYPARLLDRLNLLADFHHFCHRSLAQGENLVPGVLGDLAHTNHVGEDLSGD